MSGDDDDSSLSSTADEPINPDSKPSSNIRKHIHFGDDDDDDQRHEETEDTSTHLIIERPTPSTIRVDSSDLITRCKDFLPILSEPISKENQSSEKADDDDIIIPEISSDRSSKESGEASSTTENDDNDEGKSQEIIKKKRKKKKKKKKKKPKTNDNLNPVMSDVNNQDLTLQK